MCQQWRYCSLPQCHRYKSDLESRKWVTFMYDPFGANVLRLSWAPVMVPHSSSPIRVRCLFWVLILSYVTVLLYPIHLCYSGLLGGGGTHLHIRGSLTYSLKPCDAIWRHRSRSKLAQEWLVAWWHQAIIWTNVDLSSVRSSGIHLREIS